MEKKNDKELVELYNGPRVTTFVRTERIRWLDRQKDRMPKMVIFKNRIGKKRIGRPINRWLSKIQEGLRVMGIENWRKKTANREERIK